MDPAAHHWDRAIEYRFSAPQEGIRKSLDPAARRWGTVIGYRSGGLKDSRKFEDRVPLRWDTATVYKLDSLPDQRPVFLYDFNVNTLDGLARDILNEVDSVLITGAAEIVLANHMAAITPEYEVLIVISEP